MKNVDHHFPKPKVTFSNACFYPDQQSLCFWAKWIMQIMSALYLTFVVPAISVTFSVFHSFLQYEYFNAVLINEVDDEGNNVELGGEFLLEPNDHFNNLSVNLSLSVVQVPTNMYNKGESSACWGAAHSQRAAGLCECYLLTASWWTGRREGGRRVSGESEKWLLKLYQCHRLGEVELGGSIAVQT